MSEEAVDLYESLRKQVLEGSMCPQGLCVIIYHGMLRGLQILADESIDSSQTLPEKKHKASRSIPMDDDLIHLLTNMVSKLQPEIRHAY